MSRPAWRRQAVINAIKASDSEIGVLQSEIRQALHSESFNAERISVTIAQMVKDGTLHVWSRHMSSRYFLTAEERDQAADYLEIDYRENRRAQQLRNKQTSAQRSRKRKARMKEERANKVVPLAGKPACVTIAVPKQPPKVVIDKGVRIEICPSFNGDRWGVSGPIEGGFASMGVGRYLETSR